MADQELGWCVLELMGHIRLGGYVTEEERFGAKLGRIDVYGEAGLITTQYFGGSSVYRITPTTEPIAKAIGHKSAAPIQRWELPAVTLGSTTEPPECATCGAPVSIHGELCGDCREDDDGGPSF